MSVRELAEELVSLGHEVCVLTLRDKTADLAADEVIAGVRVVRVPLQRRWPFGQENETSSLSKMIWHLREDGTAGYTKTIQKLISEFQPDIINTHNVAGFGTKIWQEFQGLPLVHTLRDYYLACARTTLYKNGLCTGVCVDCAVTTYRRKKRTQLPDAFIGVSQRILQIHANHDLLHPGKPQYVVPNKPMTFPRPAAPEDDSVRVFKQRHSVTFGYMGRLEPEKGLPLVLDAIQSHSLANAGLIVAGHGNPSEVRRLTELAQKTGQILYIGKAKPEDYLAMIDVALVPTQWEEPFGRVAMEAMQHGVGVIASRIGGLPEVLEGYPDAVLVEDPLKTAAWRTAMEDSVIDRESVGVSTTQVTVVQRTMPMVSVAAEYERIFRVHMERATGS